MEFLAPIIWNVVFDTLLNLFNSGPTKIIGFADDGALLITGQDPTTMTELMQKALDLCQAWGTKHGLSFSPHKTAAIIFTHKYNIPHNLFKPLYIEGRDIAYTKETKYLGITLDSKLSFNSHVINKVNKGKGLLMQYKHEILKNWNSSNYATKWIYTAMIRPIITYGHIERINSQSTYINYKD